MTQQATVDLSELTPEQAALLQSPAIINKAAPPAEEEEKLYVRDLLAVNPREHDLVDASNQIHNVIFSNQMDIKEVPYSAGIRLATNDSFEVRDADGNILTATEREGDAGAPIRLLTNQVVADLDELTQDSLIQRCRDLGFPASKRTSKKEMCEFILQKNFQMNPLGSYGVDEGGLEAANVVEA
jgi:hypothetical protein